MARPGILAVWLFLLPGLAAPPARPEFEPRRVELECRITPPKGEYGYRQWVVELRRVTGEPIVQRRIGSGDTVRFQDLEPGMYVVCVFGENGRQLRRTFDLRPPAGEGTHSFYKEIQAPQLGAARSSGHRVNLKNLAATEEAREEFATGLEAQRSGDRRTAVEHFEKAVAVCPQYVDAWCNLGAMHHVLREYGRAVECLTRAVELDPGKYAAWVNLAGALISSRSYEEALEASLRAQRLQPQAALANVHLALSYYYLGRWEKAKKHFKKVLAVDPGYAISPQKFLAGIAFAEQRVPEALEYLRDYLRRHPNAPDAAAVQTTIRNLSVK